MRAMKRMISICMALAMVFSLGTVPAYAGDTLTNGSIIADDNAVLSNERVEVLDLRQPNSKTYQLADGSYQYVGYAEDIHYENENGELVEINNAITTNARDASYLALNATGKNYKYSNTANSWKVFFADDLSTPDAVVLSKDGYEIAFGMPAAASSSKVVKAISLADNKKAIANATSISLGQISTGYIGDLVKDNRVVVYENVMPGIDVAYKVRTNAVKEDIILKKATTVNSFVFSINTNGLTAAEYNNTISFRNAADEEVFKLAPMYMMDANGRYSNALSYSLEDDAVGHKLTVTADASFLQDSKTQYPVVIDPSVMITGTSDTYDTYVDEQYPNNNYYLAENMWTGGASGTNTMRSYIKFDLPTNITASQVTSAYIRVKKNAQEVPTVKAYRITSNWESDAITWNNRAGVTGTGASAECVLDTGDWYKVTVTDFVKQWFNGTYQNYGVALREHHETDSSHKTRFYTSDAPSPNKPELIINYNASSGNYTITYNGNGATGGSVPASQTVAIGSAVSLRTNSGNLAKAGRKFLGWNTNSSGTGTDYTPGSNLIPNSNLTLYAKWSALHYPARSVSMKVWVDTSYVDQYTNWLLQANTVANRAAYAFYQTFNLDISLSTPAEMTSSKSLCPNAPDICEISECGTDCNNHHSNANKILDYVKENSNANYGLNTLFYYGQASCYGGHDGLVDGLTYPLGQASIVKCEGTDWGSVRRAQHEWSHSYGAKHTDPDNNDECTSACINNSGWDKVFTAVPDVWCSRCENTMKNNLGIH